MIDLTTESLLRVDEAAKLLGVHRRTVENWFKRGLESTKIGRLVYTSREAIQRFSRPVDPQQIQENCERHYAESSAARLAREYAKKRHRI